MRLITMMSWYDEAFDDLRAAVASAARVGATHLVAVDGAYALYPHSRPTSRVEEGDVIDEACRAHGISLLLYRPSCAWEGNEVGKRKVMLQLALALAESGDWLMVMDVDHRVVAYPFDVPERLTWIAENVAEVGFYEGLTADGTPALYEMRMFIRAVPGLRMGENHYSYIFPDGRTSTILKAGHGDAPVHDLRSVVVYHAVHDRNADRRAAQTAYYEQRDTLGIER